MTIVRIWTVFALFTGLLFVFTVAQIGLSDQVQSQSLRHSRSLSVGEETGRSAIRASEGLTNRFDDNLAARLTDVEERLRIALETVEQLSRRDEEHSQSISELNERLNDGCKCATGPTAVPTPDGIKDVDEWVTALNRTEILNIKPNVARPTSDSSRREANRRRRRLFEGLLTTRALPDISVLQRRRRSLTAEEEDLVKEAAMELALMRLKSSFSAIRTQPLLGNKVVPQVVTFQQWQATKGDDFNADAGVFSVSIPGIYYFSFTMRTYDNKYIGVSLVVNDAPVVAMTTDSSDRKVMQTQSAMVHLASGDQVWLMMGPSEHFALYGNNNKYTTFNGHLLYPDYEE